MKRLTVIVYNGFDNFNAISNPSNMWDIVRFLEKCVNIENIEIITDTADETFDTSKECDLFRMTAILLHHFNLPCLDAESEFYYYFG